MTTDETRPQNDTSKVYCVSDLARLLQLGERTVWRLVDAGRVPGRLRLPGRAVRFSRKIVDTWLEGGAK